MAQDWLADVRKYAPDADETVVRGIADHCGIGLDGQDASLVSFTDPGETGRIRDVFCRKALGLTQPDAEIDTAIAQVGARMAEDPTRNRVTVYYLLAETFGKLGLFAGAAAAPVAAAAMAPPSAVPPTRAAVPPVGTMPAGAAAQLRATTINQTRARGDGIILPGCAILGAIFLGTAGLATLVGTRPDPVPVAADADLTSPVVVAPVSATAVPTAAPVVPVIPVGAGVTAQDIAGKPSLSVYFDTAKADIAPDFAAAAVPVKAWIDSHPGEQLAVSGFNDPRGNAAFNAELSKKRAQSVAAALVGLGVPQAAIDLVKPADTTETDTSLANARRVDVIVRGG